VAGPCAAGTPESGEINVITPVEAAETDYRQALVLAEELGMRPLLAHCHLGLGTVYTKVGRMAQEERLHPIVVVDMHIDQSRDDRFSTCIDDTRPRWDVDFMSRPDGPDRFACHHDDGVRHGDTACAVNDLPALDGQGLAAEERLSIWRGSASCQQHARMQESASRV
jgi:hypothetical protein